MHIVHTWRCVRFYTQNLHREFMMEQVMQKKRRKCLKIMKIDLPIQANCLTMYIVHWYVSYTMHHPTGSIYVQIRSMKFIKLDI